MEKRIILAVSLSLLLLLGWKAMIAKFYPIENKEVIVKDLISASPLPPPAAVTDRVPLAPIGKTSVFSTDRLDIVFDQSQADIREVIFKQYQSHVLRLKSGFLLAQDNLVFQKDNSSPTTFVYNGPDKKIIKRFIFDKNSYSIGLEIEIQNLSNVNLKMQLPLLLGVLDFSGNQDAVRFQDVTLALDDKVLRFNGRKDIVQENLKFIGLREKYFCVIVQSDSDKYSGFIKKANAQEAEIGLISPELVLQPGERLKQTFRIYLGPQDLRIINSIMPAWSAIIHYGIFDFIAQILLWSLDILYQLVRNWGVVIILLSIAIYFLLYPLTLKQMRSMKQMQALHPRIEELKSKYKDNPQKLNKETLELYREYKINPLSGCLPLLLQMPIFFALYQVLVRSIALKNAPFLWIKDLSAPDRIFVAPFSLPFVGNEVNILPIIMAIIMFFQQKTSLSSASGMSSEQQKMMVILFPVLFGFIFYRMPSGLVLYWLVNSILMFVYQVRVIQAK